MAAREKAMNEGEGDPKSFLMKISVWIGRSRNPELPQGLQPQGFAGAMPGKSKFLPTHSQKNLYSAFSV